VSLLFIAGCTVICIEPKLTFQGYIDGNIKKRGEHLKEVTFIEGGLIVLVICKFVVFKKGIRFLKAMPHSSFPPMPRRTS